MDRSTQQQEGEDAALLWRERLYTLVIRPLIVVGLLGCGLPFIVFVIFEVPCPCQCCRKLPEEEKQPQEPANVSLWHCLSGKLKVTTEENASQATARVQEIVIIHETFL